MESVARGFLVLTDPGEGIAPIEIAGDDTIRTAPTVTDAEGERVTDWTQVRPVTLTELVDETLPRLCAWREWADPGVATLTIGPVSARHEALVKQELTISGAIGALRALAREDDGASEYRRTLDLAISELEGGLAWLREARELLEPEEPAD